MIVPSQAIYCGEEDCGLSGRSYFAEKCRQENEGRRMKTTTIISILL